MSALGLLSGCIPLEWEKDSLLHSCYQSPSLLLAQSCSGAERSSQGILQLQAGVVLNSLRPEGKLFLFPHLFRQGGIGEMSTSKLPKQPPQSLQLGCERQENKKGVKNRGLCCVFFVGAWLHPLLSALVLLLLCCKTLQGNSSVESLLDLFLWL